MVELGVDRLFTSHKSLIAGQRVGLVTNYAMTDANLVPVIDRFRDDGDCKLVKLFGPEHGVKNSAKEGEHVSFEIDAHAQVPAYSLYGEAKRPTPEMLADIDVLVIDLQDIGTRYYTNVSTVYLCMEACVESHVPCIVLDRPNPIGGVQREGYALQPEFQSFVGMLPVPNRHGCTIGELARYIQARYLPTAALEVVELAGWRRDMLLNDTGLPWTSPSPNTTDLPMMLLYPGTCLVEGVNLSVGRGTTHPFEIVGAPWLDGHRLATWFNQQGLPGVLARPAYFTPFYSQYKGALCQGVQLHVTDAHALHALATGITLVQGIAQLFAQDFRFLMPADSAAHPFFDLLAGDTTLRQAITRGAAGQYLQHEAAAIASFSREMRAFERYE